MPVTLSIKKASIRRHLSQVDLNSIDSLRNFVSLIDRGCSNGPPTASVPASSLTLLETFKYFGYTNDIIYRFGGGKPTIPENFRVVGSTNLTSYKKFNWLSVYRPLPDSSFFSYGGYVNTLHHTSRGITGNYRDGLEHQRRSHSPNFHREYPHRRPCRTLDPIRHACPAPRFLQDSPFLLRHRPP